MDDILYPLHSFKEQFTFNPVIENTEALAKKSRIVMCGMGGSAISISLIKLLYPTLDITLHNSYGLPSVDNKEDVLFIFNSYSGSTEEMLDGFEQAKNNQLSFATISCGGELTSRSSLLSIPHIVLPSIGLEPRFAIGHQILGLLALIGEHEKIAQLKETIAKVDIITSEKNGKQLSESMHEKYPILYASSNLYPVAYLIKAAINEGSKLPCFVNVIPEANHNELQSFISHETKKYASTFSFIMFTSPHDHPRILKRLKVMSDLYSDEGYKVALLNTDHTDHVRIFELILTGYFAATHLAIARDEAPYKTPFIKIFKDRLS